MPGKFSQPEIARAIQEEVGRLLARKDRTCPELSGDRSLQGDLGLTSLDIVELLASLETRLGAGTFHISISFTELRTVADLFSATCSGTAECDIARRNENILQAAKIRAEARRHS
jgi:acyl carrier protein